MDQHDVNVFFTAPTAMRVIRKEDPDAEHAKAADLSALRAVFLAGERLDPDTYEWTTATMAEATGRDIPVVDNWWQTETGWPIAANPLGIERMPLKAGSPTVPTPGYRLRVVDPAGKDVPAGTEGLILADLPLPPGTMASIWGDDERFIATYLSTFEGTYLTGDSGYLDEDGYVFVMGRTDDVINVSGHRLSTGVLEAAIASHPAVTECAVIGVHDDTSGQSPRAFVVLSPSADPETVPAGARRAGPQGGGPRRRPQAGRRRRCPAQDPVGEDPAEDDAPDLRRRGRRGRPVDDRGSVRARRDAHDPQSTVGVTAAAASASMSTPCVNWDM